MKRIMFLFFLIILTMGTLSAASIETKGNYSLGENFVGKVSGSFNTTLIKSNIHFYRNGVPTSFDPFYLNKIESDYYVSFKIPIQKIPGNYSISIEGVKYFSGGNAYEVPVTKDFKIEDTKAFSYISPALSIPTDYDYNITLANLEELKIIVDYAREGTTTQSVTLNYGETKNVTLKTFGGNRFENILFTYNNETYSALVYSALPEIPIENETAPVNENESTTGENNSKSFWDVLFGGFSGEEDNTTVNEMNETPSKNETTTNTTNEPLIETCSEKGLPICTSDQECDGNLVTAQDAECCTGTCIAKKPAPSFGVLGWVILGIVIIGVFLFFKFKFSKTRRIPSKLLRRR